MLLTLLLADGLPSWGIRSVGLGQYEPAFIAAGVLLALAAASVPWVVRRTKWRWALVAGLLLLSAVVLASTIPRSSPRQYHERFHRPEPAPLPAPVEP